MLSVGPAAEWAGEIDRVGLLREFGAEYNSTGGNLYGCIQ